MPNAHAHFSSERIAVGGTMALLKTYQQLRKRFNKAKGYGFTLIRDTETIGPSSTLGG